MMIIELDVTPVEKARLNHSQLSGFKYTSIELHLGILTEDTAIISEISRAEAKILGIPPRSRFFVKMNGLTKDKQSFTDLLALKSEDYYIKKSKALNTLQAPALCIENNLLLGFVNAFAMKELRIIAKST